MARIELDFTEIDRLIKEIDRLIKEIDTAIYSPGFSIRSEFQWRYDSLGSNCDVYIDVPYDNSGAYIATINDKLYKIIGEVSKIKGYDNDISKKYSYVYEDILSYLGTKRSLYKEINYKINDIKSAKDFTKEDFEKMSTQDLGEYIKNLSDSQLDQEKYQNLIEYYISERLTTLTYDDLQNMLKKYSNDQLKDFFINMYGSFDENIFREFISIINSPAADFIDFLGKLKGFMDPSKEALFTLGSLFSKDDPAKVFLEMINKNKKLTEVYMKSLLKVEEVTNILKSAVITRLFNGAVILEQIGDFKGAERLLNYAVGIENGKILASLSVALSGLKFFDKLSQSKEVIGALAILEKGSELAAKYGIVKVGGKILGPGMVVLSIGISGITNFAETGGNIEMTIAYTTSDAIQSIGPIEGMLIGGTIGSFIPGAGTAVGASVGFVAGGVWTIFQFVTPIVSDIDVTESMHNITDSVVQGTHDYFEQTAEDFNNVLDGVGNFFNGTLNQLSRSFSW